MDNDGEMEIPLPSVYDDTPLPESEETTAEPIAENGGSHASLAGLTDLPAGLPPVNVDGGLQEDAVPPVDITESEPDPLIVLWKEITQDVRDFDTWSKLLQLVHEKEIEDIRKAFDGFFNQFPLCFGYWKMYCNLEQSRGDASRCEAIMKRAVAAVPLSIDLWQHYAELKKAELHSSGMEGEGQLRDLYQQATAAAGLDYASTPLWLSFIDWEISIGHTRNAVKLYSQLLLVPNLEHKSNWNRFETLVKKKPILDILFPEEQEGYKNYEDATTGELSEDAIREVYLDERRKISDATQLKIDDRLKFEEKIRRPYFHVKPLDDAEIDNWHEYLEYEIQRGSVLSVQTLFERCLVPCALYSSFWLKYVDYLSDKKQFFGNNSDLIYSIFERCTRYHCPHDAGLYLNWTLRLECDDKVREIDRLQRAAIVLERAGPICAGNPIISLRLLRIRSRMLKQQQPSSMLNGDADAVDDQANAASLLPIEQVSRLLSCSVDEGDEKKVIPNERLRSRLRIAGVVRLSRYHLKRLGDVNKAKEILREALKQKPLSDELHAAFIDCEYSRCPLDMPALRETFRYLLALDGLSERQREMLHRRRVAVLEEFAEESIDASLLLSSYAALKKIESDSDYRVKIGLKRNLDDAANEDDDDHQANGGEVEGQTAKFAALSTDNGQQNAAVKAYQLQQQQQQAALYGPPQAAAAAWYGGYGLPTAVPPVAAMPAVPTAWSMPPTRPPWGAAPPPTYAVPPRF